MNEERLSYEYGYQAVGKVRIIDPRYDVAMESLLIVPKCKCVVPQADEIRFEENRKAWFDGYLERSREVGGAQVQEAIREYKNHYPLYLKPETVYGKKYTLFFEQTDNYRWHNDRRHKYQVFKEVPMPVLRLEVEACSFPIAIRKAWREIAIGDTSLLANVTLLGAYLPVNLDNLQEDVLHRYFNAITDVDASKLRLTFPKRQFLRIADNDKEMTDIVEHERKEYAGSKAVVKELATLYKSMTGRRPPAISDIFLLEYVKDAFRNLIESLEKNDLQTLLEDYECTGNREPLANYMYEGILPGGGDCSDETLVWEWDLADGYYPRNGGSWFPFEEIYEEAQRAVYAAEAGKPEKLKELLRVYHDMRPLAKFADELMEAGYIEIVDRIIGGMKQNRVPHIHSYLTEKHWEQLNNWDS